MTASPDLAEDLILNAMVDVGVADGRLDPRELEKIQAVYARVTGKPIAPAAVVTVAEARGTAGRRFADELKDACGGLDMATRENIIRAAYLVQMADGLVGGAERKHVHDFANALKMPEIHMSAILEDVDSWQQG